jgi:hypothetical protein
VSGVDDVTGNICQALPAAAAGSLDRVAAAAGAAPGRQGLTLVHFSAQPKPCLPQTRTLNTPQHPLTPLKQTLNAPPIPQKALTLS